MFRATAVLSVVVSLAVLPSNADAGSVLFSGSGAGIDGVTLNASVLFQINDGILKVTLRNVGDTSGLLNWKDKSTNTLTGFFFDLPAGIVLTPLGARIEAGDLVQASMCSVGPCNATTTKVGGEFGYATGNWAQHAGNHAIGSAGQAAGPSNFFGPNLDGPESTNGISFGIIAPITAGNPFMPNNGNMSTSPLIEGEVVLRLAITGGALLAPQISNVSFQYGTDFGEPKFLATTVVIAPEPATVLLLVPAALALRWRRIKRTRQN